MGSYQSTVFVRVPLSLHEQILEVQRERGFGSVSETVGYLLGVAFEELARQVVAQRLREKQAASFRAQPRVTLNTLFGENEKARTWRPFRQPARRE